MKKDKTRDEINEKYLRALADYQNLQKQTDLWREEFVQYASSNLVRKLLEILDDLEKAQEHIADEGLKLIIEKLQNILREEGVVELELTGKEYNPAEAEVISTEPASPAATQGGPGEKENIISKVLQKGYRLKDKIIRPAKVIVWAKL